MNIYIINDLFWRRQILNRKRFYFTKVVDLNCALQSCNLKAGICRNLHNLKKRIKINKSVTTFHIFYRNVKYKKKEEKKKYI